MSAKATTPYQLTPSTGPRHLLRISDLEPAQLAYLLDLAAVMKHQRVGFRDAHSGKLLACYFATPSTRARVSLQAAAWRMGMLPVVLRPDELELGRRESIEDAAAVLSGYVDAIAVRSFAPSEVEEFASAASVPVINALTDEHDPCQALADLLTLREQYGDLRGRLHQTYLGDGINITELSGVRLAYVGDGNGVAHSLIEAGALAGMEVSVATPAECRPNERIVAGASETATRTGGQIKVVEDPAEAVVGADVVYTGAWGSTDDGDANDTRRTHLRQYQVTEMLMQNADADALFMHCLPAHRGEEVEPAVIDGRRSIILEQAANRVPAEQALIHTLISGDWTRDG
jgi:ornithine carbamoyltransferase